MPRKKKAASYVVGNPRGVSPEVSIITKLPRIFYAGDAVTPDDLGDAWDRYVADGYVVEAG